MTYDYDTCMAFIKESIGEESLRRNWPRVDRLITLWQEYRGLADWLETNSGLRGDREYKDNVTALNGLMQNIRNLENDLRIYEEKPIQGKTNDEFLKTLGLDNE